METVLGIDCCGQEIIPMNENVTLEVHTNRHPNTDGTAWGWIEGCTLNICWSDNKKFARDKAIELVNAWNRRVR
jgi:hypothetical protein